MRVRVVEGQSAQPQLMTEACLIGRCEQARPQRPPQARATWRPTHLDEPTVHLFGPVFIFLNF